MHIEHTGNRRSLRRRSRSKIKQRAVAKLEAELLRRVRATSGLSRVELARQLHLAPSTVGIYVDRLIAEGFLLEGRKSERDLGRPPARLELNPKGGRFIGVDFEAHNIMATAVDFSQRPLKRVHKTIRPSDSVGQIISKIERAIEQVMASDREPLLGIGVGVPGTIDSINGIALHYEHIQGWDNVPLAGRLRQRFNVNVYLENNIRSMALAELWFGHGRGLQNFVCIGVRTGIGAGVIAEGRLLRGQDNLAGEIRGWLCPAAPFESAGVSSQRWQCAGLNPLEEIVSIPAILSAASLESNGNGADSNGAFAHSLKARLADRKTRRVLANAAQTMAWVACQINAVFSPEKVILAGPLTEAGDLFLRPLTDAIDRFCRGPGRRMPVIVNSQLGSFNGALGAAALALHEWKPCR